MAAGLISPEEFIWMSKLLHERSNKARDFWALEMTSDGKEYLKKTVAFATPEKSQGKQIIQENKDYVLFILSYALDGQLLSLEDVWKIVPDFYRERLEHERWTFLTQQEHPILHRPFYQLHPCRTADLMENIPQCQDRSKYLTSWLSAVGPVVGLNLPLAYGLT
ncbi:hypothetical protein FSP39_021407 [Pinctada imbricata]|uniref:Ubiquitin-like-conjugating enzyme ATG10 n=1 Tax=Pinctada imbricata TaxID=66713 RepID=A0AA88Y0U9_PINIB|nr:hypothetical protein FSP39_021407 [Pinctada imbricata]